MCVCVTSVIWRAHAHVGYCSGEVSKQEDRQTDRRTCRRTDGQTAQDWVVATEATTQRSIYNSLTMVRITMYLYVEMDSCNWNSIYRDTVAILDYQGTILWNLCDVRNVNTLEMCRKRSTFSVTLYSKIQILSTSAMIQTLIQVGEMKTILLSWQEETNLKNIEKKVVSATTQ